MSKILGIFKKILGMFKIILKSPLLITIHTIGILVIVAAIVTQGFSNMPRFGNVKNYPATKAAMEFVNKQISQFSPNSKVELVSAVMKKGLIALNINIDKEPLNAYVTKDGTLFFPQAIALVPETTTTTKAAKVKKSDNVDVKMFTMAYCPFGLEAETAMIPVAKLLGKDVDIKPHYVIYSNYPSPEKYTEYCTGSDGKYCSMHGIEELNQDVRELCVFKYMKPSFWDYISNVNTKCTIDNISWCWKTEAAKLELDTAKIEKCFKEEKLTLLEDEVKLNTELKVEGSPMIFINGTEFTGERSAENYKTAICDAFTKAKRPAACDTKLAAPANTGTTSAGSCK